MSSKNHYINNEELKIQISLYQRSGIMNEELGAMIQSIATNYANKSSFSGYTWKEDMVSEAVLTCVKYLKNFDPAKSDNAFAYITKICHNSFKGYIKKENRHSKIKDMLYNTFDDSGNDYYTYHSIDYTDFREVEQCQP